MDKFENDVKNIIDIFSKSIAGETVKKNRELANKLIEMKEDKHFLDKVEYAQHQISSLIRIIMNVPEQKNSYIVEYIVSGLYEHFFKEVMEKVEGSCCCADKSRFIKNMTLKALKENKNLSLFEDYTKCERIKEDKERQAYWSPRTIKDTDSAMKMFWDWYLLRDLDSQK